MKKQKFTKGSRSASASRISNSKRSQNSSHTARERSLQSERAVAQVANDRVVGHHNRGMRLIVGTHAIREAIKVHGSKVISLELRQGWESVHDLRELHELAQEKRVKSQAISSALLDKLCATHQGAVLSINERLALDIGNLDETGSHTIVYLDGIEDPHNLGAIIRTSWLMGVKGIVIPEDRAVGLSPTVHKVACGGVEHVPVREEVSFANSVAQLKERGFWVYGLSHKAKQTVFDLKLPEKVVWIVGSEDKGMRTTTEKLCDELVSIPQLSETASYNASVAAAIALSETRRQHGILGAGKKS